MGGSNTVLRALRQRQPSRVNPGEPLGRQELADLVNARVEAATDRPGALDANYIGKLERGVISWPGRHYRAGLREVLGVGTDRELGLTRSRHAVLEAGIMAVPSETLAGFTQEDNTQRRGFLRLAAIATLAAETSRQIAFSDPDPSLWRTLRMTWTGLRPITPPRRTLSCCLR